jgi:hypothetical protein
LDSKNQTKTATTTGASNYDWLFDYTYGCTSSGCNIADNSNYGYWTSTAVSGDAYSTWGVGMSGNLDINHIDETRCGLRPVITVLKSKI